jgi:hypothetical protein
MRLAARQVEWPPWYRERSISLTVQAVTYPLITLSTRAQVDSKGEHGSFISALHKILQKEGIPGLYSGLKSALFGIGITNGTL